MKKSIKRIILSIAALILIVILFFVGYGMKAKSEIKTMTPVETQELTEGVFAIQDEFTNMYLVADIGQYVAFDCASNLENVSAEIQKLGVDPDDVKAVFLTHSDGDHVGALDFFKNADVYISKQEEQLINGETSRFLFFGNSIGERGYSTLEDQETITIGNIQIKGILTPGHTPGLMCFLVNNKYLFTGDALSLKDGKLDRFNEFFNMDTEKAVESMDIITSIPEVEIIFTAHHGYSENFQSIVLE